MNAFALLYEKSSEIFTKILKEQDYHFCFIDEYSLTFDKAENALQVFLYERRKLMYRILTGKMSLEQVQATYIILEGDISRF